VHTQTHTNTLSNAYLKAYSFKKYNCSGAELLNNLDRTNVFEISFLAKKLATRMH
jgi:hypothetical protein